MFFGVLLDLFQPRLDGIEQSLRGSKLVLLMAAKLDVNVDVDGSGDARSQLVVWKHYIRWKVRYVCRSNIKHIAVPLSAPVHRWEAPRFCIVLKGWDIIWASSD